MGRTHEDIQDELLVLHCQDGDTDALRALVERWDSRLGRFAWRLTADREAARDIVQDAWLAIVRGIRRLDDPARFRSWAYRIVRNKCVDWTRRRVVRRDAQENPQTAATRTDEDPQTVARTASAAWRVREALAQLPREQRTILSLHYLDEMPVAEIARVLDVPQGTVKSRLYHARNRLKQTLERNAS